MEVMAGGQKRGAVVEGRWKGAEPLWLIGIRIRSEEVQRGLRVSEVEKAIMNALKGNFPSYRLTVSPKAREVLAGKYDGLSSFPRG